MSSIISAKQRTVRIWSAGGTAINILRSYKNDHVRDAFTALEKYSFIDTSIANLHNADESEVFLLEGVDGSGKDRASNARAIHAALPDILLKQKPADFNVVIFSAAGGTGSVAGPLLLEAIMKEGHQAAAIIIGSHESTKATTNTIGTLQGLELAVKRLERPIVMHYLENDRTKSFVDNNVRPLFVLKALSILTSGRNKHLDSSDVANFFNYIKVTHHAPALAMLDVYVEKERAVAEAKNVITLAVLQKSENEILPEITTDYDTVGYLPEDEAGYDHNFYFTVSTVGLKDVFAKLAERRDDAEKTKKVSQAATSLIKGDLQADDTGLVL